jgi:transcriptional regulator with XRE-family HTH domain
MLMAERTRGRPLPHLRAWRDRKLLTQDELAEQSGVGRSTIARAEKGDEAVNYTNIRKLAKALNISPDELLSPPDGGE